MYRKVTNPDFKKIFPKDENEIGEKLLNIIKGRGGINEPEDFIISLTSTKTEVERYIEKIK